MFWEQFGSGSDDEPSVQQVRGFAAQLYLNGLGSQVRVAVSAVMALRDDTHWPRTVKDIVAGIEAECRFEREDGEADAVRLPMPPEAIVRFCISGAPAAGPTRAFVRDAAMATLAFRLLLRDGDILALDWQHLSWGAEHDPAHPGWLFVHPVWRKGNRGAEAVEWQPVDPSGSAACPVRWMTRWRDMARPSSGVGPVFTSDAGTRLASGYLTLLARKIALYCELQGRFTGHSFRIGGSTHLASQPGIGLLEVQAVGGWHSDAALRYLRTTSMAAKGLSKLAGL
jgi:integrase